jgi:hypothetical protein
MMFWLWFSAVVPMLAWPAPIYDARYRTVAGHAPHAAPAMAPAPALVR